MREVVDGGDNPREVGVGSPVGLAPAILVLATVLVEELE